MIEKVHEVINAHNSYYKSIHELELELKKEFDGLLKVTAMCQSLDIYLEFDGKDFDIHDVADMMGGVASGTYAMEKGRYTYCISLLDDNGGMVF